MFGFKKRQPNTAAPMGYCTFCGLPLERKPAFDHREPILTAYNERTGEPSFIPGYLQWACPKWDGVSRSMQGTGPHTMQSQWVRP